ncbi:hypothetical protein F4808DRAFT_456415 [Astrocystis sublimbata]|nr:hypothetical protein F4808DRAFT_456415 [Astrocystis sublimbata]
MTTASLRPPENPEDPKDPKDRDQQRKPRGRPRKQHKPVNKTPKKRKKPQTPQRPQQPRSRDDTAAELGDGWFHVRDIVDEKTERGRILYLIDWEGTDPNGRPYAPTWEPADNVTADAIDAWRDKKREGRSPKRVRTNLYQAASDAEELHPEPGEQLSSSSNPLDRLETAEPAADQPPPTRQAAAIQEAHLVVELPGALPTFDPSEFWLIPSQDPSSQATTLPERVSARDIAARDLRVVPDSQEVSGTSVSDAQGSYPDQFDFLAGSQPLDAVPDPADTSARALSSSDIPSHQPESRVVGISGFFTNPDLSTNSAVNPSTHHSRSLLDLTSIGPFPGPANGSSPIFETQPERDFHIATATPSVTESHLTIIPESLRPCPSLQFYQGSESQQSHLTNRNSTPGNSQAAQIVQPLSSHPVEESQSHLESLVLEEDRTVSETVSREEDVHTEAENSSQAPIELNGNIRVTVASEGCEIASSPQKPQVTTPVDNSPRPHSNILDSSQPIRAASAPNMDFKERLEQLRNNHFGGGSKSESPRAAVQSMPSGNIDHLGKDQTDGEGPLTVDTSGSLPSPILPIPLPSTSVPTLSRPSPEQLQAPTSNISLPDHTLSNASPFSSYSAPQTEQPATLDPSTLTLSIECHAEGSPSIATEDGLASEHIPGQSNLDEDDIQTSFPQSHLPHMATDPYEYIIPLPFQTSSRRQYNDIIRKNEASIREYNECFLATPYKSPRKEIVVKLDRMFSQLFDICDFPPFLDSLPPMSPEHMAKHVVDTNGKFSFVAALLDELQALHSDKKLHILVRSGDLMNLLGHVIQSRGCRYIRSGREVVGAADANHPLTVSVSATSEEGFGTVDADAIIAFDHTVPSDLVCSANRQATPITLVLVNFASIQHLNMRIVRDLETLERKNVLLLALVNAMRYVEEPGASNSPLEIATTFAMRIQMPDDYNDNFYWEPQPIPNEVLDNLYASNPQVDPTQLGDPGIGPSQHPANKKRSYVYDDDHNLPKRPKISQPPVVTSADGFSDRVRKVFGYDMTPASDGTVVITADKLQSLSDKFAQLESKVKQSKAREDDFRQLSDRAQEEVNGYRSSINDIQRCYMEALEERGIFDNQSKIAKEDARMLSESVESCRKEITTLKATRTELEKKLAEAHNALLHSSNPDLVRLAELEKELSEANTENQKLQRRVVLAQSDLDYSRNEYGRQSQRLSDADSENRKYAQDMQELQRQANDHIVEVNKTQNRDEVQVLTQQLNELKSSFRERTTELNMAREELKTLKSSRRETRQSSVPRSPRLSSLGVSSPRNGVRGPSAMGGPSSSRGASPQPPAAVIDGPAGSGNGVQNTGLFNQGSGANRLAHLRDPRF